MFDTLPDHRNETDLSFADAIREALRVREEFHTLAGTVNLSEFARRLATTRYESLRRVLTRERKPTVKLMQEAAAALGVEPTYFGEFCIVLAERALRREEL